MLPIGVPGKIVCVGLNYRDHAEEGGVELPKEPLLFAKWPNTLIGPGEAIVIPPLVTQADYEAELQIYQSEMVAFQEQLVGWQIAREAAVLPAESLINTFHRDFGWTFVDQEDPDQFWPFIFNTWVAQGIIIGVLFVAILALMKRKDAR